MKREDQDCVQTLRLGGAAAAQVRLIHVFVFLSVGLTWLPRLPTVVKGDHTGGSDGSSAGSHGEAEVPALPENPRQAVRSHPVAVSTSCPDRLLRLRG